jgi:transposase, IS5 family
MRPIFSQQEELTFEDQTHSLKIVKEYQKSIHEYSNILDENPEIIKLFHSDLVKLGSSEGSQAEFSSEQIFRSLLVKSIFGLTYRDTVIRISMDAALRRFTRIFSGAMIDFTFLCKANKIIDPSTWEKIHHIFMKFAISNDLITGNSLRVDSTVVETNIHYPTDSHLLWDSCRVLYRFYRKFHLKFSMNPSFRFHQRKIKKSYQYIARNAKAKSKSAKREIFIQYYYLLEQTKRVLKACDTIVDKCLLPLVHCTSKEYEELIVMMDFFPIVQSVIHQTERRVFHGEKIMASEKVFSVFEAHTELIKKGKAGKPMEFGHVTTIAQTKERFISFYHVGEKKIDDSKFTKTVLEDHKKTFIKYPDVFAADKGYWENPLVTAKWESKIPTFSICKKGTRTKAEIQREHSPKFKEAQKFRSGVEASISTLKHRFSLKKCLLKGYNSFASFIGSAIFSYNLVLIANRRLAAT